jgi:hypothetical protein
LSGNSGTSGGGIFAQVATLTLTNSTISGNQHEGLRIGFLGAATVLNTTITGNTESTSSPSFATAGGITIVSNGQATLINTIVAANSGGDVNGGFDLASHHNLIGDGSESNSFVHGTNNNQVGTTANPIDPKLSPLGNYGGVTQVHVPLRDSPALNAGDNTRT